MSGVIANRSLLIQGMRSWEPAYEAAVAVLGSESISLIHTKHGGQLWWLASRSADGLPPTAVAAALPGSKAHKGPGVYVVDGLGVAFTGDELLAQHNTANELAAWAESLGLPVITPTELAAWVPHTALIKAGEQRLWRQAVAAAAVLLMMAAATDYLMVQRASDAAASAVAPESITGDVAERMMRMGEVTGLAAAGNGAALIYTLRDGVEHLQMHVEHDKTDAVARLLPAAKLTPLENGLTAVELSPTPRGNTQ